MRFKDALWDDSDPDYAPLIKYRQGKGNYFWRPTPKYIKAGYSIKVYELGGAMGDGMDRERAAQCRELTREMLNWYNGQKEGKTPGTWGWLIARYKSDTFSSFWEVEPVTRASYREKLKLVENSIGNVLIAETDFERMASWKRMMKDKGRSDHYIKTWFTHFGLALSHGVKIGGRDSLRQECLRIKEIRSEMRIRTPAARQSFATYDHVEAIVKEMDDRGWYLEALAVLFRFEFLLRGVDVYGQWVDAEGAEGGIRRGKDIWTSGMRWDMFDADLTTVKKLINKTRNSLPEPYVFDLTQVPHIRDRLLEWPADMRNGPVFVPFKGAPVRQGDKVVFRRARKGLLPHRNDHYTRKFKDVVKDLGLPGDLRISDMRSGGITEAQGLADPKTLSHAAQHTRLSTTDIYTRDRSRAANNVVELRVNSR